MSGHENGYNRNLQMSVTGTKKEVEAARKKFDKVMDDYFDSIEDDEEVIFYGTESGRPPGDPPPPPYGD